MFPKGSSFSKISKLETKRMQDPTNNRPRKSSPSNLSSMLLMNICNTIVIDAGTISQK